MGRLAERQGFVSDRRHLLREPPAVPDGCKTVVGMLRVASITYKKTCKALKERLPRNKYRDIDRARLAYARHRKHTRAATVKLRRRLLGLLSKQTGQWNRICKIHTVDIALTAEQSKRLSALKRCIASRAHLLRKRK